MQDLANNFLARWRSVHLPDQNGNSVAFIQCITVGFASVIVCFASMSADFAKEAVVFV